MGPEAAINAVYYNAIQAIEDPAERDRFVADKRAQYVADVDLLRLASDLVLDAIVEPQDLRNELITRLAYASNKERFFSDRRHGVPPV
jgi:acetyl-CoA carboxylase carboxyltransferase component